MFGLFRENVRIALDSIKSQILRTILTIVIIGIGIWALVGILSAVKALENTISSDFASMGANTFNIQRYEFGVRVQRGNQGETRKINPVISYNDAKEFLERYDFPYAQTSISFRGTSSAEIKYGNEKTDPDIQVYGINEHYLDNTGTKVDRGRDFTFFDIENNNKVAMIGSDFVNGLFQNDNPIGKTISIRGVKFKVVGLLESKGSTFGNNQDLKVLIPIKIARSLFTQSNINYTLSVKVDDKAMMAGAQDDAIITFRNIRGLNPVEENNFGLERSDDLINRIASITGVLEVSAWIISIITILGSSIALMNIMLVSVTERTREIGVRKAMGAKRKTISTQFFIETIVIGQLGSILGIILGIATGIAFAAIFEFKFSLPWGALIGATIISFLTAVIAGSYPATKAARLDPIESLRYE
ncbi:MAG: ABC transporter permease [Bacteroidia bacterium]|nr:ABC transporter permease [Bacteroidia bacterium]MBT8274785.1 ABC transporter permease [Bacteroidia bacterium]NNF30082.1 FtsX-like permease family protein [Flavobacteriaceae bacterium]NNK53252.1 FtsX-like permease family protein [Flavobacteriaceae bacterium]NNM09492.1 FtsX-like permease family protein [Flavobacteriaceae bacterium]